MSTVYALDLNTGKLTTIPITLALSMFSDMSTDTLYVATGGTAVTALFTATTRSSATWKRLIVLPKYDTFSWLFVESKFVDADGSAASVVVTITDAAGNTLATLTVSSRDPVRLPAFREREFFVSIVSKARVTNVVLASSSEELKGL